MGKWNVPKITWGASFANTLNFGYPLDNFASYSKPRQGSEWVQATSGAEDAWVVGRDYYLQGLARWIPTTDSTGPTATGWDGSTGFRAFLEWAQDKNAFRWFPDKNSGTYITSYLFEPLADIAITPEADGTRQVNLVMRNSGSAYDGY